MKSQSLKLTIFSLVLVLAAAAFAADGGKGSFQISAPAQVNGTTLPAGDYVAKWTGSGPNVQVSITRDGKTVATVPGKVVQLSQKASTDSAELQLRGGTRELTGLQFSGKSYSLELPGNATEAKSADSVK
jgi:hypothetical protein